MRIACLQFAPQVGDIDNNLNRADAVLSKANPEDIDLLVLPELAFTGYNFKSLQHISAYLEPSGSGISSLWARTTALKHNCVVVVGYPEKVDVNPKWPTSPEYYSSAIIVNGDGETIANYRKSFLYPLDETWALEGPEGFFEGHFPGLGNTSMGICMDINPYKFEAPWHAFEFAFHVLEVESNLVIVNMAWLTREDGRMFSRMPKEPDMDTLYYWVTRLEPIIRSENDEEIIVVFCNRTGIEDDAVYAGTSAVIGVKDGEVSLYGILGRGDKELLVVDTDASPFAKLVYRPDSENGSTISSTNGEVKKPTKAGSHGSRDGESTKSSTKSSSTNKEEAKGTSERTPRETERNTSKGLVNGQGAKRNGVVVSSMAVDTDGTRSPLAGYEHIPLSLKSKAGSDSSTRSHQGSVCSADSRASRKSQMSNHSKASKTSADSKGCQTSGSNSPSKKQKPPSPKIQIPPPTPKDKDTVPTPTGPSPTPQALRPKLIIPTDAHKMPPVPHIPTPYPSGGVQQSARIYGGRVSIQHRKDIMTPTTAFDDMSPASPRFYWMPSDSMLRSPVDAGKWTPAPTESPLVNGTSKGQSHQEDTVAAMNQTSKSPLPVARASSTSPGSRSGSKSRAKINNSEEAEPKESQEDAVKSSRPTSPKSRNASRSRGPDRSDSPLVNRPDWAAIAQRLEALSPRPKSAATQRTDTFSPRPSSALAQKQSGIAESQDNIPQRPSSPKSRNASRTRPMDTDEWLNDVERHTNVSRGSIPISASPSILDRHLPRGASALSYRPDTRMSNLDSAFRPMSRAAHSRSNSVSNTDMRGSGRMGTPSVPDSTAKGTDLRAVSRGRQRTPKDSPVDGPSGRLDSPDPGTTGGTPGPVRRPSAPAYGFRSPAEQKAEMGRRSANCPIHGPHLQSRGSGDDEIVREIIVRSSPNCPTHGRKGNESRETSQKRPSLLSSQSAPAAASGTRANSSVQTAREAVEPQNNYSSSVETLNSSRVSPATPRFNPATPKAMVFIRGDDESLPSEPLSAPFLSKKLNTPKSAEQNALGQSIPRPKSAVW